MTSLLAMFALVGSIASANIPAQPEWKNDYRAARQLSLDGKKPLAVFIGSGVSGWEKVSNDGGFDQKVNQLLKDNYVCVYIDTNSEAGKSLAKDFSVTTKGLVISDRTGKTQAFYHSGELSKDLLAKAVERYSDVNRESQGTETVVHLSPPAPAAAAVQYQSTCPTCPNYAPSFGGCPNGNCNRR